MIRLWKALNQTRPDLKKNHLKNPFFVHKTFLKPFFKTRSDRTETKKNIFHKKICFLQIVQNCPKLLKLVKKNPKWSKRIQNFPKLFKIFQYCKKKIIILMVQYCLKYSKMVQRGRYGENSQKCFFKKQYKMVQDGPKWSNIVQIGPTLSSMVNNYFKCFNLSKIFKNMPFFNWPKTTKRSKIFTNFCFSSKLFEILQIGQKWFKMVQTSTKKNCQN